MAYQLDDVDIEGWAFSTLKDSTTFNAFFTSTIGGTLNYYSSTPVDGAVEDDDVETLPALTTYFTDDIGDIASEWNQVTILPITIRVEPTTTPETVGSGKAWTSPKKLRSVAIKALNTLLQNAYDLGIGGCQYQYKTHEIMITSIGEQSQDIQASIVIAFEKLNTI